MNTSDTLPNAEKGDDCSVQQQQQQREREREREKSSQCHLGIRFKDGLGTSNDCHQNQNALPEPSSSTRLTPPAKGLLSISAATPCTALTSYVRGRTSWDSRHDTCDSTAGNSRHNIGAGTAGNSRHNTGAGTAGNSRHNTGAGTAGNSCHNTVVGTASNRVVTILKLEQQGTELAQYWS